MGLYKEFCITSIHWKFSLLLIIFVSSFSFSQTIPLLEVVNKSGSEIRWNPYRDRGLIFKDDITISLMVGSNMGIINGSKIITGVSLVRKGGDIYISNESASLIYRTLKIEEDHEDIINDSELFSIPVIILDPGHGGKDSGAVGKFSDFTIYEKDVVLDVSKQIIDRLRSTYKHKKIILTRNDDTFLTLEERVEIANDVELGTKEAVLYISVHANASLNKKAQGFEVWYLPKDYRREVLQTDLPVKHNQIVNALKEDEISLESQELAASILSGMDDNIGEKSPNRGLKEEIWFVVRNAKMASILIETGFVTNNEEATRLKDPLYLKKLSDGIYNGIVEFVTSYEGDGR